MEFKYIAILLCLILGVFLSLKEWRRSNKARLIWRLAASYLAIVCFALFIFPISYQVKRAERPHELNVLTEGVSKDTINSLKGRIVTTDVRFDQALKVPRLSLLPDLSYFLKSQPDLNHLNIYGYGLPAAQLAELKDYQLNFHPAAQPEGLISGNWNSRLSDAEQLTLQGVYHHSGALPVKLFLQGLGANLDSVTIKTKGEHTFSLKGRPKQSGRAVYQVIALQGKDTLANEPVPVQVQPAAPLKVLMLAAYPDFEYKFLKDWFFEKKYPVIFRSRISKDKYSTDFLNTERSNVNKVTVTLLSKIDVLILDEDELAALSGAELAAINTAVDGGLGLFFRLTGLKASSAIGRSFSRYESPGLKNKSLTIGFPGEERLFHPLPFEQLLFLKPGINDQPLVVENTGKVLVNSRISGMGKVVAALVPATYHWLLNGQAADYSAFWSEIMTHTARKTYLSESWVMEPAKPMARQRLNITVDQSAANKAALVALNGSRLSPLQNPELPFQWQATSWATEEGWNRMSINGKTEFFYVYREKDWKTENQVAKLKVTSTFIKAQEKSRKSLETSVLIEKPVSLWWFFIPFLIAVTFLWYETKLL
ncbi:hypothetical protein [Pedobacter caeni]|uniref:Uncharacterized protein n=1 Tax=Pedobacter caeni TaxID=288992 RepID=A0A1M4VW99_9SPHI|nr:hypothetical protein [Pedobacter caeni]SHE73304.1 hypothetical protein SAMN04488522_1011047 [Pedobacter caeni]